MTSRLRDFGINIGSIEPGPKNSITDVPGVMVGHCTISDGPVQSGVTAILPHPSDTFHEKVPAAAHVINGFAKAIGLVQVVELGTLETPIILTNTLSVGIAADALIEYLLDRNPDIGLTTGTVNPVVLECNDGFLNDIRGRNVTREHVWEAISSARDGFAEGSVGAGTGMSGFGLKGGIGTSSRRVGLDDDTYTVGVLTLTNFGLPTDLTIDSCRVGRLVDSQVSGPDKGSVIAVVATDLPLSDRQLGRVARRAVVGISRTGSYIANGSGEIAVAFSTANRVPHYPAAKYQQMTVVHEDLMDSVFRAAIEATEEAVLNSLTAAEPATGRAGHKRSSLSTYLTDEAFRIRILQG